MPETMYQGLLLPEEPGRNDIAGVTADYQAILVSVMSYILDRFERTPDYPWIDTKLSILSGEDFAPGDPVRGPNAVYGWIQGRALESLALHVEWLRSTGENILVSRIERVIPVLADSLHGARQRNSGHVFFLMTPEGDPWRLAEDGRPEAVRLTADSPYSFSDLFCAKGLYAAAAVLNDQNARKDARAYCTAVFESLFDGTFVSDQQALDPKNPVQATPGRHSHGPFMIAIGMAALILEFDDDPDTVATGLRLVDYILSSYVNHDGKWPALRRNDYVEFIDDAGKPYVIKGCIPGDPGHALEFVGLSMKLFRAVRLLSNVAREQLETVKELERRIIPLLEHVYSYGFQETPGGICKLVDLRTRRVMNSDMPWWSMPETMRAALMCEARVDSDEQKAVCRRIFAACHNALLSNYVRPDRHLMAIQTLGASGRPVDVVPATPDADPGYHTGLALIDCVKMIGER